MALLDWRRALIYTHRWLGIAGSLLFIAWFASGIVLMYVGMPSLAPTERLARLPPLDLTTARIGPAEAWRAAPAAPERLLVGMAGERPVYRFWQGGRWTTVFADTGARLDRLSIRRATELAQRFAPEHASTARHDGRLTAPDQWTLLSGALMPVHRVALGDGRDTDVYVSERTGEPVLTTTRSGRRWAYLGAVVHWLYFTPFRRHAAIWAQSVIWLSVVGCVLALSGIVWGLWRLSLERRYRLRGSTARSPYAGLMKWHHYAGLVFGVVTFTWVLSGGLSMEPWGWHPGTAPTADQRAAVSGAPIPLDRIGLEELRTAAAAMHASVVPKELEVVQFRGQTYVRALDPETLEGTLVLALHPERGVFARFDDRELLEAAHAAMPEARVVDAVWLEEYDSYYYDRFGAQALPVLRVRYEDAEETWLYLDPFRGAIARKEERLTRVNRWLYHGLHSLDFPFLYDKRPLWDVVVILLSVGGLALSMTSLAQAWRRLKRHGRRLVGSRGRRRLGPAR